MSRAAKILVLMLLTFLATACGIQPAPTAKAPGYSNHLATVQSSTAANIDPGTPAHQAAPNFTVTDQFGHPFSLSQYRGKVVLLAFQDSQCTTICPLTSQEMVQAKKMLGPGAARQVQLLAVDANPRATSVADVRSYSQEHGTMQAIRFGTAPVSQLEKIWRDYAIYVAVVHGAIDHTPGVFAINPAGQEKMIYMTQMAYNGIGQQADVFARELARLLPHPTRQSRALLHQALIQESTLPRLSNVKLPQVNGRGTVTIGAHRSQLLVFTASWLSQLSPVVPQLKSLVAYQRYAAAYGLAPLTVVDERPTEPSSTAFPSLVAQAGHLNYPVAVDVSGALAQRVGVADLVWYALVNSHGQVIWAHDASYHWLAIPQLEHDVQHALTQVHH